MRRLRVRSAMGAAMLAMAAAPEAARAQSGPMWRGTGEVIGRAGEGAVAQERAETARIIRATGVSGRRFVVRVDGVLDADRRRRLADAGIGIVSAMGDGWCIVRADAARAARDAEAAAREIAGALVITPAHRVHAALAAGEVPAHAVVAEDAVLGRTIAVAIAFHADATDAEIDAVVVGAGGIERSRAASVPVVTVEMPEASLGFVSGADAVSWVEPVVPGLSECNAGCRALAQADALFAAPYGLTGAGVGVMVYDGGRVLTGHVDFQGRVTTHDATAVSDHATHVAGTIGGAGVAATTNRGIAPGVTLRSFGFESNGSGTFLATNPGDVEADWESAFGGLGCKVGNASLGTNVEVNGFPCSLQGDYTTTDAVLDALVHGQAMRAVWAAGNERQASRCDVEGFGDYFSLAPPAGSKNAIVVGAVNSDNDQVAWFSSWGPTDDGRTKPDVVAPGCQVGGDGGVTSTSSAGTTAYTVKCGTSMATPVVTGIVALLLEDFANEYPGATLPSNAMCKAALVQTAQDVGPAGPDYQSGYGSVRGRAAVDLMRTGRWAEGIVQAGAEREYLLDVPSGSGPVRITMAWDDPPGNPAVSSALVHDLDLVVFDPTGARRYPWTLNPANPGAPAVRTSEDHRNNVEQVMVDAPIPGVWTVLVRGTNVGAGSQAYALAASHGFVERTVELAWIDAPPAFAMPGAPFPVRVSASAIGQDLDASSVRIRTREGANGAWTETPMTHEGGGVFGAVVTGPACEAGFAEMEVVAQGAEAGIAMVPTGGPAVVRAGAEVLAHQTTSEADAGWVVNASGADTAKAGVWGRMAPEATAAQPGADAPDAGAQCWVTDGRAGTTVGAYDIDGGVTTVTSPVMDLEGAQSARLTFWGWFSNTAGADPGTDVMRVLVTSDGGATWTVVETIGPKGEDADGGWFTRDIELAGVIAMTDAVRVRFEASDVGLGSVVEAAVDDVAITGWWCDAEAAPTECAGDVNGDRVVNAADFTVVAANFGTASGATRAMGDVTGDGAVNASDFAVVAGAFGRACP